jgi:cyclopropane-fatty-acyl-phospholipid synthase
MTRHLLPPAAPTGLFRRAFVRRLNGLEDARLTLVEGDHRESLGDPVAPATRTATLTVHDPRFFRDLALGGHLGAVESYMEGGWDCDDLPALVRAMVRNRDLLNGMESGAARLAAPLRRLGHFLNRNSRGGSRRNIAAHYDLGNDFFRLFLDESMMYSCALFESPETTLEDAQAAKNDRICRELRLSRDDHVLEIGTGWGGFALHAASKYGCRVTTTTISREQYELARARVAAAGLEDRITLLLEDYRDLTGTYDKLVSIEMIEAVGHEYHDTFFETCGRLLAPHGAMLLQAITVTDKHYDECRREVDFIKRYIFPGSCIPSVTALLSAMARTTDLRMTSLFDLTPHYAETLRRWRANFHANHDRIRALGYPESFLRMWDFYFCYCEGGFDERFIGDVHLRFAKPRCRF